MLTVSKPKLHVLLYLRLFPANHKEYHILCYIDFRIVFTLWVCSILTDNDIRMYRQTLISRIALTRSYNICRHFFLSRSFCISLSCLFIFVCEISTSRICHYVKVIIWSPLLIITRLLIEYLAQNIYIQYLYHRLIKCTNHKIFLISYKMLKKPITQLIKN